jgi:hypothetical protein
MADPTYDYVVPVYGADGRGQLFTLISYGQVSDVAAKANINDQIVMMCERVVPNTLNNQFEIGQPVAFTFAAA